MKEVGLALTQAKRALLDARVEQRKAELRPTRNELRRAERHLTKVKQEGRLAELARR